MSQTIAGLLLLAAVALWWLSAVNARDRAKRLARAFCKRNGWQLLDQTVALSSLRPLRTAEGWRWQRRYRFEFSPDGGMRRHGELLFSGQVPLRVLAETENGQLIEENREDDAGPRAT